MCSDDYDDVATVAAHEWRRARKAHDCCACDEGIRPGERYHYTSQLFDGSWQSWKHCARCYAICTALWADGAGAIELELNCGEVWDDPPPEVARLAFLTRAEAQALWIPTAPGEGDDR